MTCSHSAMRVAFDCAYSSTCVGGRTYDIINRSENIRFTKLLNQPIFTQSNQANKTFEIMFLSNQPGH